MIWLPKSSWLRAGRITGYPLGHTAAGSVQRNVVYDTANRITGFQRSRNTGAAAYDQSFGYDGQSRLIAASNGTQSLSYEYDATGNRTGGFLGAAYRNSIASTSNRIESSTGPTAKTYQYDAMGNTLTNGSTRFTYFDTGRLQKAGQGRADSKTKCKSLCTVPGLFFPAVFVVS